MAHYLKTPILLALVFLANATTVLGQNIFQKRSDLNYSYDEFTSVFSSDTGFFTIGNGIATIPLDSNNNHSAERRLTFTWYDWQGNIVKQNNLVKNKTDYYPMWYDNNSLLNNSFYHFGSLVDSLTIAEPNTSDLFIAKFNYEGDTIWSKRFDSGNFDNGATGLIANNGDCIGIGYSVLPNGKWASRAIRIDSTGNIIWNKTYSSTYRNNTSYGAKDNVGNFYLSGQAKINSTFSPDSWRCMLLKIDSLGIQQWMKNIPGICGDYAGGLALDNDGNILLGVSKCKEVINDLAINSVLSLYKVSSITGDTIWHKEYPVQYNASNSCNFIEKLSNGDIILGGRAIKLFIQDEDTLFGRYTGVVIRTDSIGNMKWQRYYFYNEDDAENVFESHINDGKQTLDGGFILVGRTTHDTDFDDGWIIITDANGCIDLSCVNGIEELDDDDFKLSIYPNPAEEYVSIDLPIQYNTGILQVYTIQGQLVKTAAITTGGTQSFSIVDMPIGIYQLVVYSTTNKLLGREKLVVAR